MAKALVILNPSAAPEVRKSVLQALELHFPAAHIEYTVHEPRKGDPFGEIVRARLSEGFDLVVAAGGDGTVSAVVDGLAGSAVPLGIIPTGTANLVARELNIPLVPLEAAALIAGAPRSRMMDAMRIGPRVYVLVAGIGISASVAGGTTRGNKRRFGLIAYLGAAILKVFEFRPRHIEITVDGVSRKHHAVEVAILNCGILAQMLFPKGPDIHVDDGHLDVWILDTKTMLDYPRYLFRIAARRPGNPRAHFLRAERGITVKSASPLPVQADGDVIGTTPVEIEVLQGAVRVFVPEKPAVEPGLRLAREIFLMQYFSGPKRG
ncbi:MAG: diacylglycerol kinase family lipid kinase [Candidatus Krumholzibacteria bacterium]|nr:diacylglycerol kinase family lipid kinase [Candidatus Krumholzibacteria bacterium]